MPVPKKYHPKGYEILFEDRDLIVGNKAPGFLTVAALWNKDQTIHSALNDYVRKGQTKSKAKVLVVHRLDQATSGVLIFAKTESAQKVLKDNWKSTEKIYFAVTYGSFLKKSGTISSYLEEDEEYVVKSTGDDRKGKLSHTQYEVLSEVVKGNDTFSLVKIHLLTGRKNQIRVHLSEAGHPIVGDDKYGRKKSKFKNLFLHALSISFSHPFNGKPMKFEAQVPDYFKRLVEF